MPGSCLDLSRCVWLVCQTAGVSHRPGGSIGAPTSCNRLTPDIPLLLLLTLGREAKRDSKGRILVSKAEEGQLKIESAV